jgi:hypothetical protein
MLAGMVVAWLATRGPLEPSATATRESAAAI